MERLVTETFTNSKPISARSVHDLRAAHILVAGLARNCGKAIRTDIAKLQSSLKSFADVRWLIIESDSSDDTTADLESLQTSIPNFFFLSLGTLCEQLPLRTQRIAYCRNKYLDELKNSSIYGNIDYVVIADLDGTNDLLTEQAVLSCWTRGDWDVCTANQRGPYYDIWALRHASWCPSDCWQEYKSLREEGFDQERALRAAVYSRMVTVSPWSDWIEVDSAFGGLAIYRRHVLERARYVGLTDSGQELCEHVKFHAQLKSQGYRIFINPKLVNSGFTEHSEPLRIADRAKRKLKVAVKNVIGVRGVRIIKTLLGPAK